MRKKGMMIVCLTALLLTACGKAGESPDGGAADADGEMVYLSYEDFVEKEPLSEEEKIMYYKEELETMLLLNNSIADAEITILQKEDQYEVYMDLTYGEEVQEKEAVQKWAEALLNDYFSDMDNVTISFVE